jgi:adenosylhomocysteine nucleosidase
MDMSKVAIVVALEREVRPLIKDWRDCEKESGGRSFRFFEHGDFVVVCGGIGAEAARRAAEAVIASYSPALIYSAGFAGALEPRLKVGDIVQPRRVVNAGDGSSIDLAGVNPGRGEGVLVSFGSVASLEQKVKLRNSFAALAVDMEAAAVSRAAEARGVRFGVVKVISDEFDFNLPSMEQFVDGNGQFLEMRFAGFAALRPWLWPQVVRLARNSNRASRVLCDWLRTMNAESILVAEASTLQAADRP